MKHNIEEIGNRYERLSNKRGDEKRFVAKDFINFAKTNAEKYSIIDNGEDLLVGTWYASDLIQDYIRTI